MSSIRRSSVPSRPGRRRAARARWSGLPHSGGGEAPGGGGGANGPMVRNRAPIIPSGVQLQEADRPAGLADADQLVGDLLVVGREHRPDRRHHDVERLVIEGQVLRVGDAEQVGGSAPAASARAFPGLEQLRCEVAAITFGSGLRRRNRGVAGAGGDVEHALPRSDPAGLDEDRAERRPGTSPPSAGNPRTPTSCAWRALSSWSSVVDRILPTSLSFTSLGQAQSNASTPTWRASRRASSRRLPGLPVVAAVDPRVLDLGPQVVDVLEVVDLPSTPVYRGGGPCRGRSSSYRGTLETAADRARQARVATRVLRVVRRRRQRRPRGVRGRPGVAVGVGFPDGGHRPPGEVGELRLPARDHRVGCGMRSWRAGAPIRRRRARSRSPARAGRGCTGRPCSRSRTGRSRPAGDRSEPVFAPYSRVRSGRPRTPCSSAVGPFGMNCSAECARNGVTSAVQGVTDGAARSVATARARAVGRLGHRGEAAVVRAQGDIAPAAC